jgi:SpoIID/LytB domain protein
MRVQLALLPPLILLASAAAAKHLADEEALLKRAAASYQAGDFEEAGAIYRAFAAQDPAFRRQWLGLLFERQGYEALEQAMGKPKDDWERLLLARAQAAGGDWSACLASLEGLQHDDKRSLDLRAQALDATGSSLAAKAWEKVLLDSNLRRNPLAALDAFKAGTQSLQAGDWAGAEQRFKRAEGLDGSFPGLNAALAGLYAEQGRYTQERQRLERALRVDPDDSFLRDCLNQLYKAMPSLLLDLKKSEERKEALRLGQANPRVEPLKRLKGEPLVRVGLLIEAPGLKFRTGGESCLEPQGLLLPAGASYEVRCIPGTKRWTLQRLDQGAALMNLSGTTLIDPLDPGSTLSIFDVNFGSGYFWAGHEDRYYRGELQLRCTGKGLSVINSLPMEAYLKGVLPAEMPAQWPEEALKAQAVAARSETLAKLGHFATEGYDTCATVLCAVYKGVGGEESRATQAVDATAGEVLVQAGRVLDAVYMDNSGGHTQEPWDAWSGPQGISSAVFDGPRRNPWAGRFPLGPADLLDYLDDAADEVDGYASRVPGQAYASWRWVEALSRQDLERSVARRHDIGSLLAIEPLERSEAGYVLRVRFVGTKGDSIGSSDYIRTAIKGLRSNFFYVETRRDADGQAVEFLFHGGGWGHGVGLSQSGAYGMAMAGMGHKSILTHYYKEAALQRRY